MTNSAPYQRIVDDIRQRIADGRLSPGDRVPSTRQITRDWGVAIATATKALAALRQEGLVHAVAGMGTVVTRPARPTAPSTPGRDTRSTSGVAPANRPLTKERVVQAAIRIADAEGAGALTMRRLATEFDVAAMSLYRHVPDKDSLLAMMADAVFAENPLLHPAPPGWRASLEAAARLEWRMYQRHLWLAQVVSFTRPMALPNAMEHTEWMMRAVNGRGLDTATMTRIVILISNHVWSSAILLSTERDAELASGITTEQWWGSHNPRYDDAVASGRYPLLASMVEATEDPRNPDAIFEFGLHRILDGLETLIPR